MKLIHPGIAARLALLSLTLLISMLLIGLTGLFASQSQYDRGNTALAQATLIAQTIDAARDAQVQFKIQVQEWKNILLRGHRDPQTQDKYRAAFIHQSELTQTRLAHLETRLLPAIGMDSAIAGQPRRLHAQLLDQYLNALQYLRIGDNDSADDVDARVTGIDREPTRLIDQLVTQVLEHADALRAATVSQGASHNTETRLVLLALLAFTLIFGIMVTLRLARSITRPLADAVRIAQSVASGDLRTRITVTGKDETARLLEALKTMSQQLANLIGHIRHNAEHMASTTAQIASGNMDLSARTETQAASLEETAASLMQLTAAVRQNTENSQQADQLATQVSKSAEQSQHAVGQMMGSMEEINKASQKIHDIIAVIDGIAFQTNILALNAAVEAARAGEQGKGFAVVAAEVRALAQRSASAAREIKQLIEHSVQQVEAGHQQASQTDAAIRGLLQKIYQVSALIREIAQAGQEQHDGIQQVNTAIAQMDATTQHNAALVEESAAATQSLNDTATNLLRSVSQFQTGDVGQPSLPPA